MRDMGLNVTSSATLSPSSTAGPHHQTQHPGWHSPVPYLFGGLAAMLGLIAFSLLILACSYWKLSDYQEGEGVGSDGRDIENGDGKQGGAPSKAASPVFDQKIVVIMAGDEKPTFLATPMSSSGLSFGDNSNKEKKQMDDDGDDDGNKVKNAEEESTKGDGLEAAAVVPAGGDQRAQQEHWIQQSQSQSRNQNQNQSPELREN